MKYGRIINGKVLETFILPIGFTIDQCFTKEIANQFIIIPDDLNAGDDFIIEVEVVQSLEITNGEEVTLESIVE